MKNKSNKPVTKSSLLTESEKFRFQELAGIKPRSSKLVREAFPDVDPDEDEDPMSSESTTDMGNEPEQPSPDFGLDTEPDLGLDSELDGAPSADLGVPEDPMVDKIVELVSKGIRTALMDAKQSGELDISTSEPEMVDNSDLEPDLESEPNMEPTPDETEDPMGSPDDEKLNEAVPLPSPRKNDEQFYRKLEEDLFESMKKAAKRAISDNKPTNKPAVSKK